MPQFLPYPRMLFRVNPATKNEDVLVVQDATEQAAAELQGWVAKPLPPASEVETPSASLLEFPRLVFRMVGATEEAISVADADALAAAVAAGWAPKPLSHEVAAVPAAPAPLFVSLEGLTAKDAEPVIAACTSAETLAGWLAQETRKTVQALIAARLEALAKG